MSCEDTTSDETCPNSFCDDRLANLPTANAIEVLGGHSDIDATGIFLHYKPGIGQTAPPVSR